MVKYSYSSHEMQTVEDHIIKHFGSISRTIPVKESENLNLRIYVIEPAKERDFYTLITCGMGAYKMELPDDFKDTDLDRIEMLIYLSPNWNMELALSKPTGLITGETVTPIFGSMYDEWNYPVKILKNLAQAPVNNDSYFVMGNIMDDEKPLSPSTNDTGGILISPAYVSEEGCVCTLPDGDKVRFLQVMPIQTFEIDRAANLDQSLIFHRMIFHNFIVYPDRYLYDYEDIFDEGLAYLIPLYKYNLVQQTGELAAFNHMAVLLRWLIENDLVNDNFTAKYPDEINTVKTAPDSIDLRLFIADKLIGALRCEILKEDAVDFIQSYCFNDIEGGVKGGYYDAVENYAVEYFEENNIDTDEMCDLEFLFMEYTENYYQDLAKILDELYEEWSEEQE